MAGDIIRCNYDDMREVSNNFARHSDATRQLMRTVESCLSSLQGGGWLGKGAESFYREMRDLVQPAMQRLGAALLDASSATQRIAAALEQAEREAAALFSGSNTEPYVTLAAFRDDSSRAQPQQGGRTPNPPPPPEPPPLSENDGSGEHGAEPATPDDHALWREWWRKAWLARLSGREDTARHMFHYLSNSGDPLNVDVSRIREDVPPFDQALNEHYAEFRADILRQVQERINRGETGPFSFELTTPWRVFNFESVEGRHVESGEEIFSPHKRIENWYYAMGSFSYTHSAQVVATPLPNGQWQVTIHSQAHVFDRYNWDAAKSTPLGGEVVKDTTPGRLHRTGLAKEYEIWGEGDVTTETISFSPQAGVPVVPSPASGQGGQGR